MGLLWWPFSLLWWTFFLLPWQALVWVLRQGRALPGRSVQGGQALLRLPSRIEQAFPEFPEEVDRPGVFSLWFWSALAVEYLVWAANLSDVWSVGFVRGTLAAGVLVVVWLLLPWNPRASLPRKLAAPAFLAGVLAVGHLLGTSSLALYPLVFANGVFAFGFRRGVRYAAATVAAIFAGALLSGLGIGISLQLALLFVLVAILVFGICMPIVEANRRREETESLLGKLETSHGRLESAHAELKDYAGKVRELSVSEERARMAREMHDSVGHYLTVVNVQLEAATKFMDRNPERARDEVVKAKSLASEALSDVRRSVRALKPLAVEERSVADALSALARDFGSTGPAVYFEVEGEERDLSAEVRLTLYRSLQESLTNALKHSGARRISALLTFTEEGSRLTVTDDGVGVPEDATGRGFGLSALEVRVRTLGGSLKAGNAPGGGFAVEVELPTKPVTESSETHT